MVPLSGSSPLNAGNSGRARHGGSGPFTFGRIASGATGVYVRAGEHAPKFLHRLLFRYGLSHMPPSPVPVVIKGTSRHSEAPPHVYPGKGWVDQRGRARFTVKLTRLQAGSLRLRSGLVKGRHRRGLCPVCYFLGGRPGPRFTSGDVAGMTISSEPSETGSDSDPP